MKIRNKIIALAMSAAMLLSFMPAMAFAEDSVPAAGDQSEVSNIVSPVSVESYVDLTGIVGTNEFERGLFEEGNGFTVTYDDGSVKDFFYETRKFEQGGETFEVAAFFPQDEADALYYLDADFVLDDDMLFRRGDNNVTINVYPPYYVDGEGTFGTKAFPLEARVWCQYAEPVSLEFQPAEGFVPSGVIGTNWIFEDAFYGEGNKFVETVNHIVWNEDTEKYDKEESTQIEYVYCPEDAENDIREGFYAYSELPDGKLYIDYDNRLNLGYCGDCILYEGDNVVQLDYYSAPEGTVDTFVVDFEVAMRAEKYAVYTNSPSMEYTGKPISAADFAKKLKVTDSEGKTVPSYAYTYRLPENKDIGYYSFKIKFDTELYPEFPEFYEAVYSIGPKTPQIKSIKGGKKQLTINWSKLTAKQIKNIDGMYIEIATNKSFTSGYDIIQLNDNQALKGSKVIKKLKKNKKYYVRLSTYKIVPSEDGEGDYYVFSPDSKIKAGKTKKK